MAVIRKDSDFEVMRHRVDHYWFHEAPELHWIGLKKYKSKVKGKKKSDVWRWMDKKKRIFNDTDRWKDSERNATCAAFDVNELKVRPIPCKSKLSFVCINKAINIRIKKCKDKYDEYNNTLALNCIIQLKCNETELINRTMTNYNKMVEYEDSNISRHANHCETHLAIQTKKLAIRAALKKAQLENDNNDR